MGVGGSLAQRATISDSGRDVVAVAMGPGKRHITKPVCEITYGLREGGYRHTSVIVITAGFRRSSDAVDVLHQLPVRIGPHRGGPHPAVQVALIHLATCAIISFTRPD